MDASQGSVITIHCCCSFPTWPPYSLLGMLVVCPICVQVHVSEHARGRQKSSVLLPRNHIRHDAFKAESLTGQEVMIRLGRTGPEAPGICLPLPPSLWDCRCALPCLPSVSESLNLGSHACKVSTLPAEPPSQSLSLLSLTKLLSSLHVCCGWSPLPAEEPLLWDPFLTCLATVTAAVYLLGSAIRHPVHG